MTTLYLFALHLDDHPNPNPNVGAAQQRLRWCTALLLVSGALWICINV
jgi:hypothetical protein